MEITFSTSLKNKRVIVLGGSSGIGLATAQAAAEAGGEVVIASSNAARIEQALVAAQAGWRGTGCRKRVLVSYGAGFWYGAKFAD